MYAFCWRAKILLSTSYHGFRYLSGAQLQILDRLYGRIES